MKKLKLRRSQITLLATLGGGCLAIWICLVAVVVRELSETAASPTEVAAAPSEAIPEATLPPSEILTSTPTSAPTASSTPKPTDTLRPTDTPGPTNTPRPTKALSLAVGTRVILAGRDSIPVWYMYEDECVIDVAHDFVPSGTEAFIASTKICYTEDFDSLHKSYYYKVQIPSLDYPTENNWVNAEYVKVP